MTWEGSKILNRKDCWWLRHIIARACMSENTLFIAIFSVMYHPVLQALTYLCRNTGVGWTCCQEQRFPRTAVVVHTLSKGQLGLSFVWKCIVLAKNLESLKIRGVIMNEMGDSPPSYVWDVSTLHSQKQTQVKSFYRYLPSWPHGWQYFVMTTRLVFCIQKWKGKNVDCPILHKAADLWKLPEYCLRSGSI